MSTGADWERSNSWAMLCEDGQCVAECSTATVEAHWHLAICNDPGATMVGASEAYDKAGR